MAIIEFGNPKAELCQALRAVWQLKTLGIVHASTGELVFSSAILSSNSSNDATRPIVDPITRTV